MIPGIRCVSGFLAGWVVAGAAFAECAPEKRLRLETQNRSSGIPADDFACESKIARRIGNRHACVVSHDLLLAE